jgi:hypothetical protein
MFTRLFLLDLLLMLVVLDWVMAFSRQDEIGGNQFRALMDELEKGVLSIGTRFSKENWTGRVIHVLAIPSNGLAV